MITNDGGNQFPSLNDKRALLTIDVSCNLKEECAIGGEFQHSTVAIPKTKKCKENRIKYTLEFVIKVHRPKLCVATLKRITRIERQTKKGLILKL